MVDCVLNWFLLSRFWVPALAGRATAAAQGVLIELRGSSRVRLTLILRESGIPTELGDVLAQDFILTSKG
jgi:hypothetical protein